MWCRVVDVGGVCCLCWCVLIEVVLVVCCVVDLLGVYSCVLWRITLDQVGLCL